MQKNIILIGPPGSGKGTQAKNLSEHFGYIYFGTGDLMRAEAKADSAYGKIFQAVWDRGAGELIADEIVEEFLKEKIESLDFSKGVVYDGFPRTLHQAKYLENELEQEKQDFIVFDIEVSKESLIQRMASRKVCHECGKIFFKADISGLKVCDHCGGELYRRQEDEPSVVEKRLDVYEHETKPLIDFFTKEGKLQVIDGEKSIDEVEKELKRRINE